MPEFKDWPPERIAAYHSAEMANCKKMEKVHETDSYWDSVRLKVDTPLTMEETEQVNAFWSKYTFAFKNSPTIQEFYSSVSGRFDPRYCSDGLLTYYLYRFYDSPTYHTAFHDKNYREFLFKEFLCTPAVVHRINNQYYDSSFLPISYDAAITTLEKYLVKPGEKLIVKPTPGGGGNGISFLYPGDTKEIISMKLDEMNVSDFIIEKFMRCHTTYAVANPTSLNSLRIISLLYDHEITILCIVFRMGAAGKDVDNFTQGGIICSVSPEGICGDIGVDHFGNKYTIHPNGFAFSGHRLYGVDKAIDFVKRMHYRIPQFKQMSWDVAITDDGRPMLIEMNPRGQQLQQFFGILPFGERTDEIIDEYLFTFFCNLGVDKDWDYLEYADHIVLTKYEGTKKEVLVPEKINEKYVTEIKKGCFSPKSNVKRVTIPGSVKTIPEDIDSEIIPEIVMLEDCRNILIPSPHNVKAKAFPGKNVITWERTEGVTHYYIYRLKVGEKKEFFKKITAKCFCCTDWDVVAGSKYAYDVYGFNSAFGMRSKDFSRSNVVISLDNLKFQTRKNLSDTEIQLQETKNRLNRTEIQLQETKSRLSNTETQLQETKSRLSNTETQLQETKSRLSTTKTQLQGTENRLSTTKAQLQETKSRLSNTETRLHSTVNMLNAAKVEIACLKGSMSFRLGRILTWPLRKIRDLLRISN